MARVKIILFDIDGVIITIPRYFSSELVNKGYKDAEKYLNLFFHSSEFRFCLKGKNKIEEIIEPYLKQIGWKGTSDSYLIRQFRFEIQYLDQYMLFLVKSFRRNGIKCILCTNQEKKRAKYILDEAGLRSLFDSYFISSDIGYCKSEEKFWEITIRRLKEENANLQSGEIAFFDDTLINIETANKFSLKAFLFSNTEQFKKDADFLKIRF